MRLVTSDPTPAYVARSARPAADLGAHERPDAGDPALAQKRQIFFVGLGGWDTHDAQTVRLDALAGRPDADLAAFQRELDAQGVADSVTTFTASDGLDRRLRTVRRDPRRGPAAIGGDSGQGGTRGSTRIGVPGGTAAPRERERRARS